MASLMGDVAITAGGGYALKALAGLARANIGGKLGKIISDPFVRRAFEAAGFYGSNVPFCCW